LCLFVVYVSLFRIACCVVSINGPRLLFEHIIKQELNYNLILMLWSTVKIPNGPKKVEISPFHTGDEGRKRER
jgi:hypothetical protein